MRNHIFLFVLFVAFGVVEGRGSGTGENGESEGSSSSCKDCNNFPCVEILTEAVMELNNLLNASGSTTSDCDCRCRHFLVSGVYWVPNSQLSASSFLNSGLEAHRSRLFDLSDLTSTGHGTWISDSINTHQYIQAQLTADSFITGIATQGHIYDGLWVKSYKVLYSSDGMTWTTIQDAMGDRIFTGNNDQHTLVINDLDQAVLARYIRLQPQTWHLHIAMRFDVLGCPVPVGGDEN